MYWSKIAGTALGMGDVILASSGALGAERANLILILEAILSMRRRNSDP